MEVVFDQIEQLPVSEEHAKHIKVDVPWWIKNDGVLGCDGKSVLHRGPRLRDLGNLLPFESICSLHLENHEAQLHGVDVEVAANADHSTVGKPLRVRDTGHAVLIVLEPDRFSRLKALEIDFNLFVAVCGTNKSFVVGELLKLNPVIVLLRKEVVRIHTRHIRRRSFWGSLLEELRWGNLSI